MVTITNFPQSKSPRGKTSTHIYEGVSRLAKLISEDSL